MRAEDIVGLLAMVNAYDSRIDPTEAQAAAWQAAIHPEMSLGFASQQVIAYYSREQKYVLTVGYLNERWRTEKRDSRFFQALPEPQGSRIEKERGKWWMMHGIIEGVEELNTGVARDPWMAPILRARMTHGTNLQILDYKREFPKLDWDWYEKNRSAYGKRLGF